MAKEILLKCINKCQPKSKGYESESYSAEINFFLGIMTQLQTLNPAEFSFTNKEKLLKALLPPTPDEPAVTTQMLLPPFIAGSDEGRKAEGSPRFP